MKRIYIMLFLLVGFITNSRAMTMGQTVWKLFFGYAPERKPDVEMGGVPGRPVEPKPEAPVRPPMGPVNLGDLAGGDEADDIFSEIGRASKFKQLYEEEHAGTESYINIVINKVRTINQQAGGIPLAALLGAGLIGAAATAKKQAAGVVSTGKPGSVDLVKVPGWTGMFARFMSSLSDYQLRIDDVEGLVSRACSDPAALQKDSDFFETLNGQQREMLKQIIAAHKTGN